MQRSSQIKARVTEVPPSVSSLAQCLKNKPSGIFCCCFWTLSFYVFLFYDTWWQTCCKFSSVFLLNSDSAEGVFGWLFAFEFEFSCSIDKIIYLLHFPKSATRSAEVLDLPFENSVMEYFWNNKMKLQFLHKTKRERDFYLFFCNTLDARCSSVLVIFMGCLKRMKIFICSGNLAQSRLCFAPLPDELWPA